ncbi:glycine cleavage system protein GcvH [Candidatus Spongiihabitans sp.]|uniref:glycine cleavage system protein GcvH n=1 Tax=Candidatus Spongiihabitans sp. TaxID=3101308 RepID=UPI003C7003FB
MSTKYTDDHEWAREEDDLVVVGITDYAQQQLGEVVFVEPPDLDRELAKGEDAAVIESVKAAGEVKAPVSGIVVAVNESLADAPEKVNEDPDGEGWIFKIKPSDSSEIASLMDDAAYSSLIESLA